jgi:L-lactate dehydrogenase complex protein LldE
MTGIKVTLFTTCLVDQAFPQVGAAVVRLLRRGGFEVCYPADQVCCGQPFYNSGFSDEARKLAEHTIRVLEDAEAVVIPSGSCTAMIRHEYPKLYADQPEMATKVSDLAAKTFELTEFIAANSTLLATHTPGSNGSLTYHDSCHMCRSLGVREQPRQLLWAAGYRITEMEESDRCCGFGGVFYARLPEISEAMGERKIELAARSGASRVATADPGCLMRMQQSNDSDLEIMHIAEILDEVWR